MTRSARMRRSSTARGLSAALLAATLLLGACAQEPLEPEEDATAEATPEKNVFAEPDEFVGQEVRIRGRVESVVSPRMFNLEEPGETGNRLQVFSAGQTPVDEGQVVRVTGTVREFELAAFEQELQVDLEDELFKAFVGVPVVLARSVEVLERGPDEITPEPGTVGVSPAGMR